MSSKDARAKRASFSPRVEMGQSSAKGSRIFFLTRVYGWPVEGVTLAFVVPEWLWCCHLTRIGLSAFSRAIYLRLGYIHLANLAKRNLFLGLKDRRLQVFET
jgi:hypothetical protein